MQAVVSALVDAAVSARPLKPVMLERLMDAGTWVQGRTLAAGLSRSAMAMEDALADLVIEGKAEFREAVGYRLAGGAQARRAAWLLRQRKVGKAVFALEVKGEYRVGVAQCRVDAGGELGLVMYELTLPMPATGPNALAQHMRQVQAVVDFVALD